jgi:AGCS family alanine or glycine:cation symporter
VTYYGKIALSYLVGDWIHRPYNWVFCAFVFIGAVMEVEVAWSVGDMVNGLMALSNLVAVVGLSGLASRAVRAYLIKLDASREAGSITGGIA